MKPLTPYQDQHFKHLVSNLQGRLWGWKSAVVLFLVGLAVFLMGASAIATQASQPRKQSSGKHRLVLESPQADFTVRGKNGYKILVRATPNAVRLVASRGHSAVVYLDQEGHGNEHGIQGDFGKLGEISVKFSSDGSIPVEPLSGTGGSCRPPHGAVDYRGIFVGHIVFRGELKFTEVNQRRARGTTGAQRLWRCFLRKTPSSQKSPEKGKINLSAIGDPDFVSFSAGSGAISEIASLVRGGVPLGLSDLPSRGVPFRAGSLENRGGLLILRYVVAKGEPGSFRVDKDFTVATVSPPHLSRGLLNTVDVVPLDLNGKGP